MAHLEGAYEQVNHRLASIDSRLDRLEHKTDELLARIDSRFMWTAGILVATVLPLYLRH